MLLFSLSGVGSCILCLQESRFGVVCCVSTWAIFLLFLFLKLVIPDLACDAMDSIFRESSCACSCFVHSSMHSLPGAGSQGTESLPTRYASLCLWFSRRICGIVAHEWVGKAVDDSPAASKH